MPASMARQPVLVLDEAVVLNRRKIKDRRIILNRRMVLNGRKELNRLSGNSERKHLGGITWALIQQSIKTIVIALRMSRLGVDWLSLALSYFLFSRPQIASFFLSLSHAANQSAHNEVLESFLDPRPTYTLRPTYTPLPTYTALPTHTPRPTYTPFPTPTPIPPAVIIQQIEDKAQLVVVQNEMSNPSFHVGVNVGACSHGGDFIAHGVIEAGHRF